jgi:hypothetical protein
LLPVAFLFRSDLSNFEIAIDSVDNTFKVWCYHSWYYLSLAGH